MVLLGGAVLNGLNCIHVVPQPVSLEELAALFNRTVTPKAPFIPLPPLKIRTGTLHGDPASSMAPLPWLLTKAVFSRVAVVE
jgi:hypothetical protein